MKKYLPALTNDALEKTRLNPEEAVRQAALEYLIIKCGVPRSLIEVEFSLKKIKPGTRGRVDVVVWKPKPQVGLIPWLVVECKRPEKVLDSRVLVQTHRYIKVLNPLHIWITAGNQNLIWSHNPLSGLIQIESLPHFSEP